jgi:hypothetical protein
LAEGWLAKADEITPCCLAVPRRMITKGAALLGLMGHFFKGRTASLLQKGFHLKITKNSLLLSGF